MGCGTLGSNGGFPTEVGSAQCFMANASRRSKLSNRKQKSPRDSGLFKLVALNYRGAKVTAVSSWVVEPVANADVVSTKFLGMLGNALVIHTVVLKGCVNAPEIVGNKLENSGLLPLLPSRLTLLIVTLICNLHVFAYVPAGTVKLSLGLRSMVKL